MPISSRTPYPHDDSSADLLRFRFRIDVTRAVDLPGSHEIEARIIAPRHIQRPNPTLLFCVPGGFLTGGYYDLDVPGDPSYSFAASMAKHGFITATVDTLGSGQSSHPENGYQITVEHLADANHAAWTAIQDALVEGTLLSELDALPGLVSIGVGHSLGSCLTVVHQARNPCHRALLLYSFSTEGLAMYLSPEDREYMGDPAAARANLEKLARAHFPDGPYPGRASGDSDDGGPAFSTGNADPAAVTALQGAGTNLIGSAGLLTLFPGGFAAEARQVAVPVFVASGDHDLHTAQKTPPAFPKSPEVIAYTLPNCWHCHFVAEKRAELWDRSARWIHGRVANLS